MAKRKIKTSSGYDKDFEKVEPYNFNNNIQILDDFEIYKLNEYKIKKENELNPPRPSRR